MWLILIDAMSIALALTFTIVLALAVPFALCAEVVAEHGTEDEVLFGREFVQWTRDDEAGSLQTFTSPEINILILSSCRLKQVWDALTLQSLNGLLTILLITGEQHHVAHTFMQLVDVVHQYLEFHGSCCRSCHS